MVDFEFGGLDVGAVVGVRTGVWYSVGAFVLGLFFRLIAIEVYI